MLQIYYILLNVANDKSVFRKNWKDISPDFVSGCPKGGVCRWVARQSFGLIYLRGSFVYV